MKFPRVDGDNVPSYAQGSFAWKWTATFEAFVSRFGLGDRPRATPPGDYRFVVNGRRREAGAEVPYRVVSDSFAVAPWDGITVDDIRLESNRTVSLEIGPRRTVPVFGGKPPLTTELGPIDYPDSYSDEGKGALHRRRAHVLPRPARAGRPGEGRVVLLRLLLPAVDGRRATPRPSR